MEIVRDETIHRTIQKMIQYDSTYTHAYKQTTWLQFTVSRRLETYLCCRWQSSPDRRCLYHNHSQQSAAEALCFRQVRPSERACGNARWSRVVRGSILCDPIQPNVSADWPNPTQPTKSGKNWTQPDTANSGAYSLVVTYFYTHNLSRTFSQPSHKIKFNCLVQPNLI